MPARILDGKAIAAEMRHELREQAERTSERLGRPPSLRILLVGDDEPSHLYANHLEKAAGAVGIIASTERRPADSNETELRQVILDLNLDSTVDGVIVAMPLPSHISLEAVSTTLLASKDVDGITIANAGNLYLGRPGHVPSTAASIMEILHRCEVPIEGKRAVVIGRSPVVGKPVALLLLREHATVTICHTRTVGLPEITRQADILIAAAGTAGCIDGGMLKRGSVVIDAGINATESGMVGDVSFDSAAEVAGAITPVPGGVGPLTNVLLLRSVLEAAEARHGI